MSGFIFDIREFTLLDGNTVTLTDDEVAVVEHAGVEAANDYLLLVFAGPRLSAPERLSPLGIILPSQLARQVAGEIVSITQRPQPPSWWTSH